MFDASYRYSVELRGNRSASDNLYRVRKRARNECGGRIERGALVTVNRRSNRRVGSVHIPAMPWAESNRSGEISRQRFVRFD